MASAAHETAMPAAHRLPSVAGAPVPPAPALRLQALVVDHLPPPAGELASACPADSLAAGERRIEALVDEDVEHAGPWRPRQQAGLAVQGDLDGRGHAPGRLRCLERVFRQ